MEAHDSSDAPAAAAAPTPGDGLLHPLAMLAVGLLVLNDHWLKAAMPGFFTGKLSDVAGLTFFPLLLEACYERVRLRSLGFTPSASITLCCVFVTGLGFCAVELWPAAADAFATGLGALQWPFRSLRAGRLLALSRVQHVADAEDLLALPALLIPALVGMRRAG